jgi:hypothetical protein
VFWFVGIAFIFFVIPFVIWGRETANMSVEETGSVKSVKTTSQAKLEAELQA